ncbi:MAG: hypothetical protein DWQ44_09330 [Bacteroidetes bacterium]|nr:MAG: hypothetical protein DWQ33_02450 [Bacteroidota bacterium]REK06486.1 MAG: hypothetical protein DWQ39_03120 [Bacteroidota bacterium]REK33252.1 MAG: hypothetical protein DWQ44_09330 [Bacteroidota bacterium]REK47089.1 MAG: hypothetical protein DWQ48_13665 [Bacteroidota bacterium]
MAINQNHPFEEIDGVRCAVVEKNLSPERLNFLKELLEYNGYSVVIKDSPPPKTQAKEGEEPAAPAPETFTLAVTDVRFNVTNAIFGRLLRTKKNEIVTRAYWFQEESVSNDTIPYYQKK